MMSGVDMLATWFLIVLLGNAGVTTVPFVNKDFCEAARVHVHAANPLAEGVCVSTGVAETGGMNNGR